MKKPKCRECEFLIEREKISHLSRMIGYTAECAKNGVFFTLEDIELAPLWCPFKEHDKMKDKL